MRKIAFTLAAVLCLSAVAIAQTKTPQTGTTPTDPVVIKAGELQITQSEFETALKTIPAEYQAYASGPGKKAFAEDYLRMRLLAREAEKHGLHNDPAIVRQLKLLRENALANAELEKIESAMATSEEDLKKIYEERKGTFEQVKARHILIAFKGSRAAQPGKKELTDEEAKAKAEDIRKKLVAGADFAELAKTESDDRGSAARGGELGTFSRGQMVPEFEKAAFETKPGELSPVVRTEFGYHIVKVDEHTSQPLSEVREQLDRELRQKKVQAKLEEMKLAAKPTFDDAYFAPPAPPAASQNEGSPSPAATQPKDEAAKPQSTSKKPQ